MVSVPAEFVLFALMLVGVAVFHRHTFAVAASGLAAITAYKLAFSGFRHGSGWTGLALHLGHEWVVLANLFCLLMGFALLAKHFEESRIPEVLPRFLPNGWPGGLVLLVLIAVLSSFLDNIAAALIGGTMAATVYRGRVHIGYLAAIVAASNAGGAPSVVGDTTTTMMWIAGIGPLAVLHAAVASASALVVFGIPAALVQQRHQPIAADAPSGVRVDWVRGAIVLFILATAIVANVVVNVDYPEQADTFPFIGVSVWAALLLAAPWRQPAWSLLRESLVGSLFLLSLVLCASFMPVEQLPAASWPAALSLGFVSAVFDNIPLTALAIKQGGYDWGMLAYAVGFGGSMIWFGSSAGVALSSRFPAARSVYLWLRHGWFVAVAYVVGFMVLLGTLGWQPTPERQNPEAAAATSAPPGPARP
jgi:Na+/H+ antiporter NhaD/arsenite permease-like protein